MQYENQLLRSLDEPSVVVMDNASYHGRMENHLPFTAKKAEIEEYADRNGIKLPATGTIKVYREILALPENKKVS